MEERILGLDDLLDELSKELLGQAGDVKYVGIATITRPDLEKLKAANKKARIKMIGTLTFAEDVTPELVSETIESVKVRGKITAPDEVKEALDKL